jgi:hypothetical protein
MTYKNFEHWTMNVFMTNNAHLFFGHNEPIPINTPCILDGMWIRNIFHSIFMSLLTTMIKYVLIIHMYMSLPT